MGFVLPVLEDRHCAYIVKQGGGGEDCKHLPNIVVDYASGADRGENCPPGQQTMTCLLGRQAQLWKGVGMIAAPPAGPKAADNYA